MQRKKCFATRDVLGRRVLGYGRRGALGRRVVGYGRGVAASIILATLTLARGGAGSEPDGEPDRAGAYNILHVFTWAKNPTGNLIFDAAGNLYGTTLGSGGSSTAGDGIVFKLKRKPDGTWAYSIIHSFQGANGSNPRAGLVLDAAGNLFGTTEYGGGCAITGAGCGVVFKLRSNPNGTWTESVLHSFTGLDGNNPEAGLILDRAGNLYGTTYNGGGWDGYGSGVVFKLKPNPGGTWTESVLYGFTGGADGGEPEAGLVFDTAGNLYGTTGNGGTYGVGVVFKLKPNPDGTWTESVLYSFTGGVDGGIPRAGLIFNAAGNLYGTTYSGGADGYGVVFKLKLHSDGTWTENVAYSFTGGVDGGLPLAGLVFNTAGDLYGTTGFGGAYNCGVVFKLRPTTGGWSETVLHTFGGYGCGPWAPVIFDPGGNLYGTTFVGSINYGLMFEIKGQGQ